MVKIRRRKVPAVVGLGEAAEILGVKKSNLRVQSGMPEPLQDRQIEGFAVSATPLWPAAEVRELAEKRKRQKDAGAAAS